MVDGIPRHKFVDRRVLPRATHGWPFQFCVPSARRGKKKKYAFSKGQNIILEKNKRSRENKYPHPSWTASKICSTSEPNKIVWNRNREAKRRSCLQLDISRISLLAEFRNQGTGKTRIRQPHTHQRVLNSLQDAENGNCSFAARSHR